MNNIEKVDIAIFAPSKRAALKSAGIRTLHELHDAMGGSQPPIKGFGVQWYWDICYTCLSVMLDANSVGLGTSIKDAVRDNAQQMKKRQTRQSQYWKK